MTKTYNNYSRLDQFYTTKETARYCMNLLKDYFDLKQYFLFEPSAGNGSFSHLFHNNSLAIDIEPKSSNIKQQDFLTMPCSIFNNKSVFVIGNPPFGKNSSLAIKFFNHAALLSEYIAFIVPKTFKKASIHNRLDLNFILYKEFEIHNNSFTYNNEPYSVPCVFQIWQKTNTKRKLTKIKTKSKYLDFVHRKDAEFAIRRVGVLAGKVIDNFSNFKDSSHYFIIAKHPDTKKIIHNNFERLNNISSNTAGNPSLSKHELICFLERERFNSQIE